MQALCCAYCQSGSMEKNCLNAYDSDNNLYNACKAPETDAPCTDVNAVIPDKPVTPEHRPSYNEHNSIPELMTRDICVSNLAFDYSTWQFRTGYKSLCCSYCRAGSMVSVDFECNCMHTCCAQPMPIAHLGSLTCKEQFMHAVSSAGLGCAKHGSDFCVCRAFL